MPILDQFILFSFSFTFSVNDIITTVIMFYKQGLLSHLFKQSEYSVLVIIIISACRNSSETVLLAVSLLLADKAQFVHKPAQVELQLDRPQLPYSENIRAHYRRRQPSPTHNTHKRPIQSQNLQNDQNIFEIFKIIPLKSSNAQNASKVSKILPNLQSYQNKITMNHH